jgi:hypothetical protein
VIGATLDVHGDAVCVLQVFWDYSSDPQVYEVRQIFTGTQAAWQSAVDSMANGWVSILSKQGLS